MTDTNVQVTPTPTEADTAPNEAVLAEGEVSQDNEAQEGGEEHDVNGELKTVRKALDKRNRYINNQRNRIRALEAEIAKMKDGFGKDAPKAPEMDKYESVLDYLKAEQGHTLEQKLAEQEHKGKLAALEQQKQAALQQRVMEVDAQVQELFSNNAEFKSVITSNLAVIDAMPDHIESLMAEIDNPPAATYALLKEGRLQDLYHMPPAIAAAHLVQAEIRGQQYLQQAAQRTVPQQQAPKPIGSLKGSGKSGKSLADMSAEELAKRFLK